MIMTPENLFRKNNTNTIIYIPKKDVLIVGGKYKTHTDMLVSMRDKYTSKVSGYDGITLDDFMKKKNTSIALRNSVQDIGEALLARSIFYPKDNFFDVSFWPSNKKNELFTDSVFKKFISKLITHENYNNADYCRLYVNYSNFSPYDTYRKGWVILKYNIKPEIELESSTNKNQKEKPSDKTKIYVINGYNYTLEDLKVKRLELHFRGSSYIDPVLCAIDLEKYPELSGYVPVNCAKSPKKIEPLPNSYKRGHGDWKGIPAWMATSESVDFKNWLSLNE